MRRGFRMFGRSALLLGLLGGCGVRSSGVVPVSGDMFGVQVRSSDLSAATERGLAEATGYCGAQSAGQQPQLLRSQIGRDDYQLVFRCAAAAPTPRAPVTPPPPPQPFAVASLAAIPLPAAGPMVVASPAFPGYAPAPATPNPAFAAPSPYPAANPYPTLAGPAQPDPRRGLPPLSATPVGPLLGVAPSARPDLPNYPTPEAPPASLSPLGYGGAPAYTPPGYTPSAYQAPAYAPSAYAPSAYAPSAYAPSAYAPSAYAPSAYAPAATVPPTSPLAPLSSPFPRGSPAVPGYAPSGYAPSGYAPGASAVPYSAPGLQPLVSPIGPGGGPRSGLPVDAPLAALSSIAGAPQVPARPLQPLAETADAPRLATPGLDGGTFGAPTAPGRGPAPVSASPPPSFWQAR